MWTTVQIVFGLLGILFVLGGDKLSIPALGYAGIACLGLTSMAIGWEAIFTRQIRLGRRRHGRQRTNVYRARCNFAWCSVQPDGFVPDSDCNHGLFQCRWTGGFFADGAPAWIASPCIWIAPSYAGVITLTGARELSQGPRWIVILNLLVSRLLPGVILVVLGLGALWLGVFEIMAPEAFDEMGGGFLEVIYGLR